MAFVSDWSLSVYHGAPEPTSKSSDLPATFAWTVYRVQFAGGTVPGKRGQEELQVPGGVSRSSQKLRPRAPWAFLLSNPQTRLRVTSSGLPRPARQEVGCEVPRRSRLQRAAAMPSSQLVSQLLEL